MKLIFKDGSEVQKVVIELFEKKEANHKKSIKIIEEVTGCKVLSTTQLGYRWCFDWSYSWSFKNVYFEDGIIDVPGYTHEVDSNGRNHHIVNKRKKTIYNKLLERFQKEVQVTSISALHKFGVKNEAESVSYSWGLYKEESGEIALYINPKIYDLLDFSKSIENGEQTITVEQ